MRDRIWIKAKQENRISRILNKSRTQYKCRIGSGVMCYNGTGRVPIRPLASASVPTGRRKKRKNDRIETY
jgi:hypothetical protein